MSSAERLRTRQESLALSFVAYAGMWGRAAIEARRLFDLQTRFLRSTRPLGGRFRLVWGPAVDRSWVGWHHHAAFAVEDAADPGRVIVAVRGTNPLSLQNMLSEAGAVFEQRRWPRGDGEPRIAAGVHRGLQRLLSMRAPAPGVSCSATLLEFLRARTSGAPGEVRVHTTGHSLGGCFASTLAVLLADAQGRAEEGEQAWDPERRAIVSTTTFGAFTPGNADFAAHAASRLGTRCDPVVNSLDVTPRTFAEADLEVLPALYEPQIACGAILRRWMEHTRRRLARAGVAYARLAGGATLRGALRPGGRSYVAEMMWQHVQAYPQLLDLSGALGVRALLLGHPDRALDLAAAGAAAPAAFDERKP